jgi:DNA invertase Pin-like site-specific DNA recombinase
MRYGYARVSSKGQDYAGQVEALKAAGCERIFSDKLSGKSRARPEPDKVLRRLQAGDTIVITKVDRIAHSVRDLWNILHEVIEEKGAQFVSRAIGASNKDDPSLCPPPVKLRVLIRFRQARRRILALGLFFQFQTYC